MTTQLASSVASRPLTRVPARRSRTVRVATLIIGVAALAASVIVSVAIGSREIPPSEVLDALFGRGDPLVVAAVESRIPRTVLAIAVGAALSLSGAAMQGLTRNPLAEPGILGITSGAALAVVLGIVYAGVSTAFGYIWFALAGSAAAAVLVYLLGSAGGRRATPLRLTLAGAATAAVLLSAVRFVLLPRAQSLQAFEQWQVGGVGGAKWDSLATLAPLFLVGLVLVFASARGLDAIALGDDTAKALGQRVGVVRLVAGIGAILLCATATALAGPIIFVGLLIPHAARLIVGADYRWVLGFCLVWGGTILVLADVLGRVVTRPSDIAVGIVTTVVGAPLFILLVRRQKVREV